MSYELVAVSTPRHWEALHAIRRSVLFEERHSGVAYDAHHPDDRAPHNTPLLLMCDDTPVAVARLDDLGDGTGVVRLVAVVTAMQGQGLGRVLGELVDTLARSRGMHTLLVNAVPEALGYYRALGWEPHAWDPEELIGIASDCVQMRKCLTAL